MPTTPIMPSRSKLRGCVANIMLGDTRRCAVPERTTTERLVRLVEQGEVINQACAARVLGVSKERVRQIVNAEGLALGRRMQPNTLITWPCPNCGKSVEMWTTQRNHRKGAYCPPCASHFGTLGQERRRVGRSCEVLGCERPHRARGWCATHYLRWKNGQAQGPIRRRSGTAVGCSKALCDEPHDSKGLCRLHYRMLRTVLNYEPARG